MIYLDYAANTPADLEVLDTYYKESLNTLANPNSKHIPGKEARNRLDLITARTAGS
jgi:cysteine desulfurase